MRPYGRGRAPYGLNPFTRGCRAGEPAHFTRELAAAAAGPRRPKGFPHGPSLPRSAKDDSSHADPPGHGHGHLGHLIEVLDALNALMRHSRYYKPADE